MESLSNYLAKIEIQDIDLQDSAFTLRILSQTEWDFQSEFGEL